MMTPRERILAAIKHKPVDRIPMDYWGTPEATKKLMKELGVSDEMQLWHNIILSRRLKPIISGRKRTGLIFRV